MNEHEKHTYRTDQQRLSDRARRVIGPGEE